VILQQVIEPAQMAKLLHSGKTDLLQRFVSNKTRRAFKAYLVWDAAAGKVGFEFEPRPAGKAAARKPAAAKPTPAAKAEPGTAAVPAKAAAAAKGTRAVKPAAARKTTVRKSAVRNSTGSAN